MNLLLAIGQIYIPSSIKMRRLVELFNTTANAFQSKAPEYKGLPFNEYLKLYASFTRDNAEESLRQGNDLEVKNRLYEGSYRLAQELKRSFHVDSVDDVMKMARLIYKVLNIDFKNDKNGEVIIRQCYFSSFYSSQVCQLISSLDEGLMEGLSGGTFRFSQRITEGKKHCMARLSFDRSQF
jgi:hypothetical protein